jgi:glycosyltransferase involved in cell wall biosynthesis
MALKILQVSSSAHIGGGEVHVSDLCQGLVERGHVVELVVRPASALPALIKDRRIKLHCLPLRNALDIVSAYRLSRLIRNRRFDIVHAHVARDYPLCALAVKLAPPARLIITRHLHYPLKNNLVYRWILRQAATVIGPSERILDGLRAQFDIEHNRLVKIPNWVDLKKFAALPDRAAARAALGLWRAWAVGVVGQLAPHKGQETFLQAAALVARRLSDVEFLIVGQDQSSHQAFTQKLKALSEASGIADRVIFHQFTPDIPQVLSALDVLTMPSWDEPFGLILLEGMAAGKALIATAAGGPLEIVQDASTGLLVPPRDPVSLAEKIEQLLSDEPLRLRLGAAARARAAECFDREQIIDRIEQLYDKIT